MAGRIRTGTRPAAQRYRLIRTRHCPDAILLANAARVAVAGGALPKREASRVANAEPPRYSVWCRNIRRQATRQYEKCGLRCSAPWFHDRIQPSESISSRAYSRMLAANDNNRRSGSERIVRV